MTHNKNWSHLRGRFSLLEKDGFISVINMIRIIKNIQAIQPSKRRGEKTLPPPPPRMYTVNIS